MRLHAYSIVEPCFNSHEGCIMFVAQSATFELRAMLTTNFCLSLIYVFIISNFGYV
nr:MAG TPA: hypothetical protein [Caudoviricetes sp.]